MNHNIIIRNLEAALKSALHTAKLMELTAKRGVTLDLKPVYAVIENLEQDIRQAYARRDS